MAKGRTVRFEFDPFEVLGVDAPKGAERKQVLEAAAEYVHEQMLSYVAEQNSPVSGHGAFAALSADYKKRKKEQGGSPVPNLELSGDMLDATTTYVKGNRIVTEVKGQEGAKADGHCNHSGESELKTRRYIPDDDEMWKAAILQGVRRIIRSGGD